MADSIESLLWATFFLSSLLQGKAWDYQNIEDWGNVSPTCNVGQNQSPIDLRADVIGQNNSRPSINFLDYNSLPEEVNIQNSGHTIHVTGVWPSNRPNVTAAGVFSNEVYVFNNAHIHWGTENNNGTEHSILGQRYAAELHLVHVNIRYQNLADAINDANGIAVVAVLFQVNDTVPPNSGMQALAAMTETVLSSDSSNTLSSINLASFLPNPIGPFYSYSGSLTTPPCTENVRWIVFAEPQPINSNIVNTFRSVQLENDDRANVRSLQNINNRQIEYYP